jgi:predicted phosphodiesterase
MPKRTLTQSVTLIRDKQRVTLDAGKTHDLSTEEISDILAVSPGALSTTATVDLSDADVTDVTDNKDPDATLTAAEKKAVKDAAKAAQKNATGPGGSDL